MKRNSLIFFILMLLSCVSFANTIRIAVIDTGINLKKIPNVSICKDGLIDFTGEGISDPIGHGTNITAIISEQLKDIDHCFYILKVYNKKVEYTKKAQFGAFLKTILLNPDFVNYSSSGYTVDEVERLLINRIMASGIKFVTAAGNLNKNLDLDCSAYPACYGGMIVAGNLDTNGYKASSSNYGKIVNCWKVGTNINAGGIKLSGTSQSTAFCTASFAKEKYLQNLKHSGINKNKEKSQ